MTNEERMQADGAFLPLRYQLVRELGRGGMGVVYLAQDTQLGPVAIKLLPPHGSNPEETTRFRREAADLATLSHPNIVTLLEAGEGQDRDYIVMEYVGGGCLRDLVGKVPLRAMLEIFQQVCDGLGYIHERGLIHRDLKPDNILLTPEKQARITDFGLARRVEPRTKLTQAGSILGTCSYLPPEQISSSQVGLGADLYSLGVCLFECVTGRLPFVEDMDFRVLQAHIKSPPPLPSTLRPGLPPALDDLILQLLQKRPEQRPESAARVHQRLGEILAQLPDLGDASAGLELAGRAVVLENLLGVVTQGLQGAGTACLLVGERGSGRSQLLEQVVKSLRREPQARVLRLLAAPVGQALPALWKRLGRDPIELVRLFENGGVPAVAQGLSRVLAAQVPLALIVDDFERQDSLCRQVVLALLNGPVPARNCWLVGLESGERPSFDGALPSVKLEELEDSVLLKLAESRLGQRPGPRLAQLLRERSAGSPRRLRVWCGCLASQLEGSELREEPTGTLEDTARAALSQRGGLLEVARLAIWLQDAASRELLVAASELPAEQVTSVIQELEKRGLFEWQPGYPEDEEEPRLRFALPSLAAEIRAEGAGAAVHVQLARALERHGTPAQRARHLGLARQPLAAQALSEQAERLRTGGYLEEALEFWTLAGEVSKGPEQAQARIQASRCRVELGQASQAVAELTLLLENPTAEPLRALVTLTLARALAATGDRAAALALLNQEPEPEDVGLLVEELELLSELQPDSQEARESLEQAVQRSHALPPLVQLRLEILWGERLLEANSAREARRVLEGSLSRALSADHSFWLTRCLHALGRAYQANGQHERAIPCYDQALDSCGGAYPAAEEARLWQDLSRAYQARGDLASATLAWERATPLLPADPASLLHLAALQQSSGHLAQAERTLRCLDHPDARVQLGLVLLQAGRPEEALAHLEGARSERRVEALCGLTEVYMRLERFSEAVVTAEKALAAARTTEGDWAVRARVMLAEACLAEQMWESAARNLLEARALAPPDELLERIREAESRLPVSPARVVEETPPEVPAAPPRTRADFVPLPATLAIDKLLAESEPPLWKKRPFKAVAAVVVLGLLAFGALTLAPSAPQVEASPSVAQASPAQASPKKRLAKPTPPPKKSPNKPARPAAKKPPARPAAARPGGRPTPPRAGSSALVSFLLAVLAGSALGLVTGYGKGRSLSAEGAIPQDVRHESQVTARSVLGLVLIAGLGTGALMGPAWYRLGPLDWLYTQVSAVIEVYFGATLAHLAGIFAAFVVVATPITTLVSALVRFLVSRLPSRLEPD